MDRVILIFLLFFSLSVHAECIDLEFEIIGAQGNTRTFCHSGNKRSLVEKKCSNSDCKLVKNVKNFQPAVSVKNIVYDGKTPIEQSICKLYKGQFLHVRFKDKDYQANTALCYFPRHDLYTTPLWIKKL